MNTFLFSRMVSEDVQAAELRTEIKVEKRYGRQPRDRKPYINKRQRMADAAWEKFQQRQAQLA